MAPTVYDIPASPPCRTIYLLQKAVGLTINFKNIDLFTGEHLKPEFLKINPQHSVPTLVDDDGFVVWDSHAIMIYLLEKYVKESSLYPKCIKTRATIHQRLHFESGILFARLRNTTYPILFGNAKEVTAEQSDGLKEAYDLLEAFLEGNEYIAGKQLTIADFSIVTSLMNASVFVPICPKGFPRLTAWLKNIQSLPYFNETNEKGFRAFEEYAKSKLA